MADDARVVCHFWLATVRSNKFGAEWLKSTFRLRGKQADLLLLPKHRFDPSVFRVGGKSALAIQRRIYSSAPLLTFASILSLENFVHLLVVIHSCALRMMALLLFDIADNFGNFAASH